VFVFVPSPTQNLPFGHKMYGYCSTQDA
jgi:hypothetical protein